MDLGAAFYTPEEYADCLKILFDVNRLLGFFRSTVKLLKQFPGDASLVDVGCGGGLFLLHLSQHYPNMQFLGLDVSEVAIAQATNEKVFWANITASAAPYIFNLQFAHGISSVIF